MAEEQDELAVRPELPPGAIDVRAVLQANLERDRAEVARLQKLVDDEKRAAARGYALALALVGLFVALSWPRWQAEAEAAAAGNP